VVPGVVPGDEEADDKPAGAASLILSSTNAGRNPHTSAATTGIRARVRANTGRWNTLVPIRVIPADTATTTAMNSHANGFFAVTRSVSGLMMARATKTRTMATVGPQRSHADGAAAIQAA